MDLNNKHVLITGGSGGLGLALTKQLIAKNCQVHICGRSQEQLQKAKQTIKSKQLAIWRCDVSDYQQVEAMVKKIDQVDILINNAGVWLEGDLEKNDPVVIGQVIDVNLKGTVLATRAVLPVMKRLGEGFIINVISTSGLVSRPDSMIYAASKWGVVGFTESLKENLKNTKIKVCSFYPGGMNTNLFKKAGFDKKVNQWMNPDKVAEIIVFILERDESMTIDSLVVKRRGQ